MTTKPTGRAPGAPRKFEVAPTEFGRWLDRSGMTIDHFAERAGISVRSAYRLRNGGRPTLAVAEKILAMASGDLTLSSFRE